MSLFVTPIEILRSRQILNKRNASFFQCAVELLGEEGGFFSLWRALPLTVLRDAPGLALYIATFETMKDVCTRVKVKRMTLCNESGVDKVGKTTIGGISAQEMEREEKKDIGLACRVFAAACSGVVFWMYALPVDTIKTKVEAEIVRAGGAKIGEGKCTIYNIFLQLKILHISLLYSLPSFVYSWLRDIQLILLFPKV